MRSHWMRVFAVVVLAGSGLTTALADTFVIDTRASMIAFRSQQQVEIRSPASVDWVDLYDQSRAQISGGTVGWLKLHDSSHARIDGGEIGFLFVYGQSTARISQVQSLSWLVLDGPGARVEIEARDVTYSLNRLSGTWSDGSAFSFWAFNAQNYYPSDVFPGNIVIASIPQSLVVSAVPEPGQALMFVLGVFVAGSAIRRRARP